MERWVKAGVVGTFICAFLQLWANYRIEHPAPSSVGNHSMSAVTSAEVLLALHYGTPIIAGILLFSSAWIAFRKRSKDSDSSLVRDVVRGQLAQWRDMLTDVYDESRNKGIEWTLAAALEKHPAFPSLRHYLSPRSSKAIIGKTFIGPPNEALQFISDDIDKIAKTCGL